MLSKEIEVVNPVCDELVKPALPRPVLTSMPFAVCDELVKPALPRPVLTLFSQRQRKQNR